MRHSIPSGGVTTAWLPFNREGGLSREPRRTDDPSPPYSGQGFLPKLRITRRLPRGRPSSTPRRRFPRGIARSSDSDMEGRLACVEEYAPSSQNCAHLKETWGELSRPVPPTHPQIHHLSPLGGEMYFRGERFSLRNHPPEFEAPPPSRSATLTPSSGSV